jgi:hypothetical protein
MFGERDTKMEDLLETPQKIGDSTKIGLPTKQMLKQLPKCSIQSTFSAFFKPKIVDGR